VLADALRLEGTDPFSRYGVKQTMSDSAIEALEGQLAAMRSEISSLREATTKKNSKRIGNDAERLVSDLIQGFYPEASVVQTCRDGLSGDLRAEFIHHGEPVPLMVEVKRHQDSVPRREVEAFVAAVNAQRGRISGAVFISLTSNVAGQRPFSVMLSDDGSTEMVFVSHAEEQPERIRLALEFLLARHEHRASELELTQDSLNKARRLLRQMGQLEQAIVRRIGSLPAELGKLAAVREEACAALAVGR